MTRKRATLITGAGGEIGQSLVRRLAEATQGQALVTLDLGELPEGLRPAVSEAVQADIRDESVLRDLDERYTFDRVFHLAALLSTSGERDPKRAQSVNVDGTLGLLDLAARSTARGGAATRFLFPSSIAVHGVPVAERASLPPVTEDQHLLPITMYGVNKLSCEHLGRYWSEHYGRLLGDAEPAPRIDFRAIRFPGLLSAFTKPSGGTSDYGPEMLHAAAAGEAYDCFVTAETRLPFMAMPDAVRALLELEAADGSRLQRRAYSVAGFAPTAADFAQRTERAFPGARIGYAVHQGRQGIVDSWPGQTDCSAAAKEWDFQAEYDFERCFEDYLLPELR